jgi:hypothetical protein
MLVQHQIFPAGRSDAPSRACQGFLQQLQGAAQALLLTIATCCSIGPELL